MGEVTENHYNRPGSEVPGFGLRVQGAEIPEYWSVGVLGKNHSYLQLHHPSSLSGNLGVSSLSGVSGVGCQEGISEDLKPEHLSNNQ